MGLPGKNDQPIPEKRPDFVVKTKKQRTFQLVDFIVLANQKAKIKEIETKNRKITEPSK